LHLGAPFEIEPDGQAGGAALAVVVTGVRQRRGVVPFFIDWQGSIYPITTSAEGLEVIS
jgi:hypothetical protein